VKNTAPRAQSYAQRLGSIARPRVKLCPYPLGKYLIIA
jgi:hypothetical protein